MPTAQPYYLAWAAPVPTPVAPRTATPTATAAVKQEQINLQCTAHWDCVFCADPSHFMGSCPLIEGYIQAGKASRGANGCLYPLDGQHISRIQGTGCLRECLDRLPALAPAPPSSVVTSGIFSVTNSTTDAILDIEPSVFMAPSQHGSFSDWGQSEAKSPADVETHTSLCLYSTSFTFHPTALLLSIRSKLPFGC